MSAPAWGTPPPAPAALVALLQRLADASEGEAFRLRTMPARPLGALARANQHDRDADDARALAAALAAEPTNVGRGRIVSQWGTASGDDPAPPSSAPRRGVGTGR